MTYRLQLNVQWFMSNKKPRDRQESFNRCQRPTVGAVFKLLFTLSDYNADYLAIVVIISKLEIFGSVLIAGNSAGNPPP